MSLNNLKKGDEVYYIPDLYGEKNRIVKVIRVTDKLLICDCGNYTSGNKKELKFRKEDGRLVGNTNKWHFPRIVELTQELKLKVEQERLANLLKRIDYSKLKLPKLKELWDIVIRRE